MSERGHHIEDWVDATRLIGRPAMRSPLNEALQRLRETIEPMPRVTERSLLSPYVLTDDFDHDLDDYRHPRIEQSLDEVGEVRPSQPIVP